MARKSEILYVKGMNLSEESEAEEDDDLDIWDDRKLNDAYDKALRMANAEVAKRVAMSTNNQAQKKEGQTPNKKEKAATKENSSKGKKKGSMQWKAGMPCRAVYEADGIEYEAFVLRIISQEECIVRFLGYENSEIVSISTLKPTLGTEERTRQIEQALDDKTDEAYLCQSPNVEKMECVSDRMTSGGSTDRSTHTKKKSAKKKKPKKTRPLSDFDPPEFPFAMPPMPGMKNLGSMDMPLPPPPPLPLSGRPDSEDQAISSMLLSWYMSGYYTGLYQGLKRAKEDRRNM